MTKRTLATGILALALLATPRLASAGVHFSFGIGLPFFGAVVAPAPAVVVPGPAYVPPPAYYPYPYPPGVTYGPPGYYAGSVVHPTRQRQAPRLVQAFALNRYLLASWRTTHGRKRW